MEIADVVERRRETGVEAGAPRAMRPVEQSVDPVDQPSLILSEAESKDPDY